MQHDNFIKWKHFPRYWPFVRGIHRWPVNSPHKGQWCGALMFVLSAPEKQLSKPSRRRWFDTPSRSSWRHRNERTKLYATIRCQVAWRFCNQHLWSQIANTLGSTSIRYRSDAKMAGRCLIDVDPMALAIWDIIWDSQEITFILFCGIFLITYTCTTFNGCSGRRLYWL